MNNDAIQSIVRVYDKHSPVLRNEEVPSLLILVGMLFD